MRQTEPEDSLQMRFYRHGIQAHTDGMSVNSCDSTCPVRRAWFKAGWHDADIEAGNSVLKKEES